MALGDKPPLEYDAGKIQALLEKLDRKIKGTEAISRKNIQDLSKELEASLTALETSLTDKMNAVTGEESFSAILPVPENLKVYELGFWGFAHVDPFTKWKFIGRLVGYEFYGSPNATLDDNGNYQFDVQPEPYNQTGTHWGDGPDDEYLYTKHPTDDDKSFILDNRLIFINPAKQLILQNVTRSTNGITTSEDTNKLIDTNNYFLNIVPGMKAHNLRRQTMLLDAGNAWATVTGVGAGELTLDKDIFKTGDDYEVGVGLIEPGAYGLIEPKFKIKAVGVTWNNGDAWKIRQYPQNKLFSIGAFCTFTKRLGNYYIKARSVGKGTSYSDFTEVVTSEGISSTALLETPVIVPPIHAVGSDEDGVRCEMVDGKPVCPNHGPIVDDAGNVDWTQITDGTREIAHYDVFGFERSVVELVYEEIDNDDPTIYQALRETLTEGIEGDVS